MSINKALSGSLSASTAILMALIVPLQPVLSAIPIGQTASSEARVDGIWVPSGTSLLSPAKVETGNAPAVVHLSTGEVVAVAPRSSAILASVGGGVRLAVQKGRVAYTSETGEVEYLSPTETLVANAQGEVREGPRTVEGAADERICQLRNWTTQLWQTCRHDEPDDGDCLWDLIEIPMTEVPTRLEKTALLACEDRNDLGLECDCARNVPVLWWIPLAAVGGGWALSEIIEKEKESASPFTP